MEELQSNRERCLQLTEYQLLSVELSVKLFQPMKWTKWTISLFCLISWLKSAWFLSMWPSQIHYLWNNIKKWIMAVIKSNKYQKMFDRRWGESAHPIIFWLLNIVIKMPRFVNCIQYTVEIMFLIYLLWKE